MTPFEPLAPSVVPTVDLVALAHHAPGLPDGSATVLRRVDGRRSVEEIVSGSPLERQATVALLARLVDARILVFPVADEPGTAIPAAASSERVETSREPATEGEEPTEIGSPPVGPAAVRDEPAERDSPAIDPSEAITDPELGPVAAEAPTLPFVAALAIPPPPPVTSAPPPIEVVRFAPPAETRRERLLRESSALESACGDVGPVPLALAREVVRPGGFPVLRAESEAEDDPEIAALVYGNRRRRMAVLVALLLVATLVALVYAGWLVSARGTGDGASESAGAEGTQDATRVTTGDG